jgi:hypothetical protein
MAKKKELTQKELEKELSLIEEKRKELLEQQEKFISQEVTELLAKLTGLQTQSDIAKKLISGWAGVAVVTEAKPAKKTSGRMTKVEAMQLRDEVLQWMMQHAPEDKPQPTATIVQHFPQLADRPFSVFMKDYIKEQKIMAVGEKRNTRYCVGPE